jgi:hypothetical protein
MTTYVVPDAPADPEAAALDLRWKYRAYDGLGSMSSVVDQIDPR